MKYYKRDFDFNDQISQIEASALSTHFSQLREKINDSYDFYSLKQLSKDIYDTSEKLVHHIYMTNYKEVFAKHDSKDILYHICSHVFYLSALFEEYDFDKGIELMEKAEMECC